MSTICRSCAAPVLWVITQREKRMPVDAEPSDKGNVLLRPDGKGCVLSGPALDDARTRGDRLHVPHFATCPHWKQWRKRA